MKSSCRLSPAEDVDELRKNGSKCGHLRKSGDEHKREEDKEHD